MRAAALWAALHPRRCGTTLPARAQDKNLTFQFMCYVPVMFGLGKRPAPTSRELAELRAEIATLAARVRTCESECERMHTDAKKWWKRASAAEQRAERNQEQEIGAAPVAVTPVPPLPWGARGRRVKRTLAGHFERRPGLEFEAAEAVDGDTAKGA